MAVPRPFELMPHELQELLEEMVDATMGDLSSEFLLLPRGDAFLAYSDFRAAYEVLKRHADAFSDLSEGKAMEAAIENSRVFCVLRAMLGMTPPEWAEMARVEFSADIDQGPARMLDRKCRESTKYIKTMEARHEARLEKTIAAGGKTINAQKSITRIEALIRVAVRYITQGAPEDVDGMVHRLDKFDTKEGEKSLRHAAAEHVPYPVLLYERYLGRPFAAHRDAVSERVGELVGE